jgi:hypothetical protein
MQKHELWVLWSLFRLRKIALLIRDHATLGLLNTNLDVCCVMHHACRTCCTRQVVATDPTPGAAAAVDKARQS